MSLLLTDRQRVDLNNSILDYLLSQPDVFQASAAAFQQEAGVTMEGGSSKGLLEKKWTSVVRLQRKVMELEAKVETMQHRGIGEEVAAKVSMGDSKMLPRPPAKKSMSGHRAGVTAVATHPVYSFFASGSEDCTIRMWDHETCQYERTLKGHTGSITGLAFDSRGSVLASCSADMSAKLWDMSTFTCSKTLKGHDHTISGIAFLPSGDQMLTCSRDHTSKLWEVSTGFCLRTYAAHSDWVKCLSISLDGRNFSSGSVDHTIIVWEVGSSQPLQTLRGHEHVVESVCYGKRPRDAAAIMASEGVGSPGSVVAEDYSYLASGSRDRSVRLWDPLSGACLTVFAAHENWVRCVIFHPSYKYLLSCSDDKTIRVLDIKEGRCMRTLAEAHGHFVTSLSMSISYPVLVSGGVDKNVNIWSCV
ncbi:Lissencephaly-1 [Ochromonadaceae sp. CCMP2298]|nr:Lissencephaly-1 [Ochromonadaceae sp. CCMP2298]